MGAALPALTALTAQPAATPYAGEILAWRGLLVRQRAELLREGRLGDGLAGERELTLRLIERALAKIDGRSALTFGICERTGQPIARERLELMPWTPLSIAGATELEDQFMTLDDLLAE